MDYGSESSCVVTEGVCALLPTAVVQADISATSTLILALVLVKDAAPAAWPALLELCLALLFFLLLRVNGSAQEPPHPTWW